MEGDLSSFVERTRSLVEESGEMAARTTDLRITLPFLEALGWDVHGPDVEADYPVEATVEGEPRTVTVDYALSLSGTPSVFVSTAGLGDSIDPEDGRRLEAAMAAAGVDWGVITNGESYVFVGVDAEGPSHARCSLGELPERQSLLANYTRPAARRRLERRRGELRQSAAREVSNRREGVESAVSEALTDGVEDPVATELAAASEQFVTAVLAAMADGDHPETAVVDERGRTGRDAPDPDPSGSEDDGDSTTGASTRESTDGTPAARQNGHDGTGEGSGSADRSGRTDGADAGGSGAGEDGSSAAGPAGTDDGETSDPATADGPDDAGGDGDASDAVNRRGAASTAAGTSDEQYVVRFFDGRNSVGAIGHGTPAGALVQAVEYLVEQHALDGGITLPWGPTDDRAVINHDPVHPDGTEMVDAAQISNGFFVCTTIGGEAIQTAVEDLAETSNLRVMFQGDW